MQVACVVRGPGGLLALGMLAASLIGGTAFEHERRVAGGGPDLQAAVTRDGFVIAEAISEGQRITELARDGGRRASSTFTRPGDVRVVGTRGGVVAVYEEGRRIRLRHVKDGSEAGMFGSSVRMVCQGVATSEARFAVGWLESDDKFWFVHGPVADAGALEATRVDGDAVVLAGKKEWCGIAAAESKVALLWRDRDRVFLNTCTAKKCGGLAGAMKLERDHLILGFGCLRNACLLATRDRRGKTALSFVTESGSIKWTKSLDISVTDVPIVGAGDRAFAVAAGNRVLRIERGGAMREVWAGPVARGVPRLAWAAGRLAIAHGSPADVVSIEMPR